MRLNNWLACLVRTPTTSRGFRIRPTEGITNPFIKVKTFYRAMYSPVFLFWIWGGSWTSQTLPHCDGEPGFHGDGREEGGTRLKRPQDWLTFFFVQLERSLTASIYSI